MAKYKYDVYEVVEEYQTFGIENGQIRQISIVNDKVEVYEFNNENGIYSKLSVDSNSARSYYYKIENEYFRFDESVRWIGGSKRYYGAKLTKVEVRKVKVNGSLIESIVAEENTYPTNGIKDGKWYIRREKIAEIKAKFNNDNLTKAYYKDSQNVVRKLSKAYFKDINGNIKRLI